MCQVIYVLCIPNPVYDRILEVQSSKARALAKGACITCAPAVCSFFVTARMVSLVFCIDSVYIDGMTDDNEQLLIPLVLIGLQRQSWF